MTRAVWTRISKPASLPTKTRDKASGAGAARLLASLPLRVDVSVACSRKAGSLKSSKAWLVALPHIPAWSETRTRVRLGRSNWMAIAIQMTL